MKIILNSPSMKMGMELLTDVSMLIPSVHAFMFPLADSHCISLEFNEKAKYSKDQRALIYTLERAQ